MTVEELRDLARAAEPLSVHAVALDAREQFVAYNDLLFRFRERVVTARNSLVLGLPVEPELEQELRFVAEALPEMRRRAEAAVLASRPASRA